MGRRHVKEFRPDEALRLITADREGRSLRCPSCGSDAIGRSPGRPDPGEPAPGRVVLHCDGCGRVVSYIDRPETPALS
jgi:hypothetical protein